MIDQTTGYAAMSRRDERRNGYSTWRVGSLILALALPIAFLLVAGHVASTEPQIRQIATLILLMGAGFALAHGLGYRARSLYLKPIVTPWMAWPLMMSAFALLTLG